MFRLPVFLVLFGYLAWRVPHLLPYKLWRWRWWVRMTLCACFALAISFRSFYRQYDPGVDSIFVSAWGWFGLSLLGLLASVLLILVPIDIVRTLWRAGKFAWRGFKRPNLPASPTRRAFLRETAATSILGLPVLTTAAGLISAVRGPKVKEIDVPVPELHPDLRGLRIAQISDLHVGPTIREEYVASVVDQVLALKPDLIAVTGDMVDGSVEALSKHVAPLARLSAPLGVFYVTGNHEYYAGADTWVPKFVEMGMRHLSNEHVILERGSSRLMLAGVPDPVGKRRDPNHVSSPIEAMKGAAPADFKILLAHRPQACFEAADAGFDLQLSGHTHAGQFIPFALYVPFVHPYVRGLNRHARRLWVYVNAGTGYWGPPTRFGVPSEITLLRLT